MNTAELPGVDAPVLGPDDARDMLDRQTEVLELIAAAVPLHDVLAEILNSLAETLREKQTMEGKIASLTAQGKIQGVVMTCLPLLVMFALMQIEPVAMAPLFSTWPGYLTLAVIAVMEIMGYFFIRKITRIDV